MEKKLNPSDNIIDFREFLYKILNNWFYFLLSIVLSVIIAFAYTRYSREYYKTSTKIIINSDNESSAASELLYNNLSDQNNSSIKDANKVVGATAARLARAEGMEAHARTGDIRLKKYGHSS